MGAVLVAKSGLENSSLGDKRKISKVMHIHSFLNESSSQGLFKYINFNLLTKHTKAHKKVGFSKR